MASCWRSRTVSSLTLEFLWPRWFFQQTFKSGKELLALLTQTSYTPEKLTAGLEPDPTHGGLVQMIVPFQMGENLRFHPFVFFWEKNNTPLGPEAETPQVQMPSVVLFWMETAPVTRGAVFVASWWWWVEMVMSRWLFKKTGAVLFFFFEATLGKFEVNHSQWFPMSQFEVDHPLQKNHQMPTVGSTVIPCQKKQGHKARKCGKPPW